MIRRLIRAVTPKSLRRSIRLKMYSIIRKLKAPRMIWGYLDTNDNWHEKTRISDTVFFYHEENVKISNKVFIWHFTIVDGTGGIEIGEGTQIGAWVGIFTHSSHVSIRLYGHHYHEIDESDKKGYLIKPVKIGKFVFIGSRSMISPGVEVGDGALISAGSFVTKNVEPFQIISGNPAIVVGDTRKLDRRYLKDSLIKSWYEEWQKN